MHTHAKVLYVDMENVKMVPMHHCHWLVQVDKPTIPDYSNIFKIIHMNKDFRKLKWYLIFKVDDIV